jgi:hypothetical protein
MIDARWIVEHVPARGDEAVIDGRCTGGPAEPKSGWPPPGAEWFVFRDGLIAEIRDRPTMGGD